MRVLLVHHSETSNSYRPDAVAAQIRSFHRYHTTTKGWPDVAYNFFVDRYGGLWEGRTGSLDGPVIGDATGGTQGFSQLCCFIGSHTSEAPTPEAQDAMVSLLAWLSVRYEIDALGWTSFASRGSNRWPTGVTVETATIEGHRAMSKTTCPGDAAYPLVIGPFRQLVAALVAPARPSTTTASVATSAPETTVTAASTTVGESESPSPADSVAQTSQPAAKSVPPEDVGGGSDHRVPLGLGLGAAVVGGGGLAALLLRRRRSETPPPLGRPDRVAPTGDDRTGPR